ncbi:hypothetical protein LDENG_00255880 [Lucifuga dentata]|nr:hypothetical protein LDENG_00255880 [Lucifuga dentata]
MLNQLHVKDKDDELSEEDRALLSQTITEPDLCPTDVLHIFAINKQVDQHNTATLALLHDHIIKIDADDDKEDPRTGRMTRQAAPCQGTKKELPDTIQVAEGACVMITRNISIEHGVINGSMGKLTRITKITVCLTSQTDLGLEMDNKNAGKRCSSNVQGEHDNLVYLERQEENLKQKGVVRRQFPLKLAFACTMHKVQGMMTSSAVMSLKHIFEPGMAYVALSRVTSLSGLHLLDMDENKICANPEITAGLESMTEASLDRVMPLFHISQSLNRHETFIIVHHNTEGLPSCVNDIKSHHELCLADILCLTETHLQGSFVADSLQLEGYSMFKLNRRVSYTNFPQIANRSGGGVAVYVKNHIQVCEKQYLQNVTDQEFVALKVEAPLKALCSCVQTSRLLCEIIPVKPGKPFGVPGDHGPSPHHCLWRF